MLFLSILEKVPKGALQHILIETRYLDEEQGSARPIQNPTHMGVRDFVADVPDTVIC